jgi:DNA-binding XRE family transcriptional regulator
MRARRTNVGITRNELALLVGLSASAIAGIENGHHAPGREVAQKISAALAVEATSIFDFRECECGCGESTVARFVSGHNCRRAGHGKAIQQAHQARRRRLGIPETKECRKCGRTFTRSDVPNQNLSHWLAREHCSFECAHGPPVEERPCRYCGEMYRPDDNAPTRLFCSRRCAQTNRVHELVRDGRRLVADAFIEHMPGKARRIIKLRLAPKPGRPLKYHPRTAELVRRMRDEGRSWNEIAAEVGVPRDTAREMAGARQRRP